MYTLVLVRHGESEWNRRNLFTGWTDVELTPEGVEDARKMGRKLHDQGFNFGIGFTSVLKRAGLTLELILEEMDKSKIEIVKDWHLNERHYGALQGKSKIDILDELEWQEVHAFRRSYDVRPPQLSVDDPRNPVHDPKYSGIPTELLPRGESLEDAYHRIIPYFESTIIPALREHTEVIVSAHGNTLRVLLKYLDSLSHNEVEGTEFAIGEMVVYRLNQDLTIISKEFLRAKKHTKYGRDM